MGQKVDPRCLRLGINRTWSSKWYADNKKTYAKTLHNDLRLRKLIQDKLSHASVAEVEIQRNSNRVTLVIHSAKPGIIIGRQGENIEKLREFFEKETSEKYEINIKEVKKPDLNAKLVGENIARQVEKRISYRRACKMTIERSMDSGAKGIKIKVAGRLNGVEIARSETFTKGKIPLQTLRADIDYAKIPAHTTYGVIGIKVWIYKGEIFKDAKKNLEARD